MRAFVRITPPPFPGLFVWTAGSSWQPKVGVGAKIEIVLTPLRSFRGEHNRTVA